MSSVRMCDKCSSIFSERSEGWQTFTASTIKKIDGRRQQVIDVLDACPKCAIPTDQENEMMILRPSLESGTVVESKE